MSVLPVFMPLATPAQNKEIYYSLHDQIINKRFESGSPIRRYGHRCQYYAFVELIPPGSTVLDAGCGEGVLSILLAKQGCKVLGVDLSEPNIVAAKEYAAREGVSDRVEFVVGDAEHLPAEDKSFDYVVSSHVLEHVPDFVQGVREIARVARTNGIIAIPTCLNPAAMVLLGHDKYWNISRKSLYAFFWGMLKVLGALLTGKEGVNEGYAGREDLIHIWRFPRVGKKLLREGGLKVVRYRGSSYIFPYFPFLIPLSRLLLKGCWLPGLRNFGYGTTFVCTAAHREDR